MIADLLGQVAVIVLGLGLVVYFILRAKHKAQATRTPSSSPVRDTSESRAPKAGRQP